MNLTEKIKDYIRKTYALNFDSFCIVGIRGVDYNEGIVTLNDDAIDQFNDTLMIIKNDTNTKFFRATMDPGLHWILKPMSVLGAARLNEGMYAYKRGLHKGNDAFIQHSKVTVTRDQNKNAKWESGEPSETGFFGIHIHARFSGGKVGSNSAGCTVIDSLWDQKPWKDFKETLYASKQVIFPYIVIDQKTYKEIA